MHGGYNVKLFYHVLILQAISSNKENVFKNVAQIRQQSKRQTSARAKCIVQKHKFEHIVTKPWCVLKVTYRPITLHTKKDITVLAKQEALSTHEIKILHLYSNDNVWQKCSALHGLQRCHVYYTSHTRICYVDVCVCVCGATSKQMNLIKQVCKRDVDIR